MISDDDDDDDDEENTFDCKKTLPLFPASLLQDMKTRTDEQ